MSYSFRDLLRMAIRENRQKIKEIAKDFGVTEKELAVWIEQHIEELCSEADSQCKQIDPIKAVDQTVEEMSKDRFDNFAKGVIKIVKERMKRKKKPSDSDETDESQVAQTRPPEQQETMVLESRREKIGN